MHVWKEPSGRRTFPTVGARLRWSYANLAMAHAALHDGAERYGPFPYFQIRAKLYAGLRDGRMAIGSMFDDERLKLLGPVSCAYCGVEAPDTADHLLPRVKGGMDWGENLVACCRSCNSAKGGLDVMAWHRKRGAFPSLAVTRRYLKIAFQFASDSKAMDWEVSHPDVSALPFDVMAVPMNFPPPAQLFWSISGT